MELGGYQIEREIGRGGMGVVLRARAPDGRLVAIKLLLHAQKAEARARFGREQRLLASFGESDGFVPLLAAGDSPRGPFLVMPFVEGGTLREKLDRGPLAVDEARALGVALARAIGSAHGKGIVHRDLKPENVLFTSARRPLIADLGLAKHFDLDSSAGGQSVSLSKTGETKGTVGYMPPEQLGDSRNVGPPADVFSLGAILYECLAGRSPFEADNAHAMIGLAATGSFVPLRKERREVPAGLARAIERALRPLPAERFADGQAFAQALADEAPEPARGRFAFALGFLVVLAIGGLAAFFVLRELRPREPGPVASTPVVAGSPAPAPTSTPARSPRATAGKFPPWCTEFAVSGRARLDAVLGTHAGHVGMRAETMAWSPDGAYVLAASTDHNVWLLDAATGEPLRAPDTFTQSVTGLAFSPDSHLYVGGAVDGQGKLFEAATGKLLAEWRRASFWLEGVAFSPDGREVAAANERGAIEVRDLTGTVTATLGPVGATLPDGKKVRHSPDAVAYLPDGRLVSGGREVPDKTTYDIYVWEPHGQKTPVAVLKGQAGFVRGLAVSSAGLILSAGLGGAVEIWDPKSQARQSAFEFPGGAVASAFSPDGRHAAATGVHGAVFVWDTSSGSKVLSLDPHDATGTGVAFSPDGKRIASSSYDGTVRVRSYATEKDVWPHEGGHGFGVRSLTVAGTRLVSAGEDGTCRVWDRATGREERRLIDHEPRELNEADPSVNSVSATLDGHSVAIGCSDGTVRFMDPTSGEERRVFHPGKAANVTAVAIAGDGHHALGGDDQFGIKLWDESETIAQDVVNFEDTAEIDKGAGFAKACFAAALSADGRFALAGYDGRLIVWEVEHRRRDVELIEKAGAVKCVAFAPDGQSAISTSADPAIRVWDLARIRRGAPPEPRLLSGHEKPVDAVLFFPDGERLVSASEDGTIRFWRTREGRELDRIDLRSSFDRPTSLALTPDSKSLYVGTARGVILKFDVSAVK